MFLLSFYPPCEWIWNPLSLKVYCVCRGGDMYCLAVGRVIFCIFLESRQIYLKQRVGLLYCSLPWRFFQQIPRIVFLLGTGSLVEAFAEYIDGRSKELSALAGQTWPAWDAIIWDSVKMLTLSQICIH